MKAIRCWAAVAAAVALCLLPGTAADAQAAEPPAATLSIAVDKPGPAISPVMHGLFFEDINFGADGGLYAELIQNRSFEHEDRLYAWSKISRDGGDGDLEVAASGPLNPENTHFARLQIRSGGSDAGGGGFGVTSSGYGGIVLNQGENYHFSLYARRDEAFQGDLLVVLEDEAGSRFGEQRIRGLTTQWKRFPGVLKSAGRTANARLVVLATGGTGRVDLDMISLFPENTWKKRPNGLRADLVQKLAEMRPGFMRFPGGCIIEGRDIANAYRWKDTIGDIAERPQNWNRWMEGQPLSYYQTYGLGFFEYFQLCEDIGAAPVPVVNCGMACQFQSGELAPMDQLGPWVQDALDLIEFANGPVTSKWGAIRAAMGHPKPFNMKHIGIGNEQWGEEYFKRYRVFYDAIKARYPEIITVTTSGPGVDDANWNLAWNKFKSGTPAEIVDEHYYRAPQWFLDQADRYDAYDRNGPKVFAGEFAGHGAGRRNNLGVALAEAAFMTGLVRNADVVHMASYAPLLARVGSTQWQPDLIWFDNTRVYGSPSYYVQALFSRHKGDVVLPLSIAQPPPVVEPARGMVGVGTWLTQAEYRDIKVTREDGQTLYESDFSKGSGGIGDWKTRRGNWQIVDGVLRQTGAQDNVRALIGQTTWSDYTLSLKARKLSGREGFLIIFGAPDTETVSWWNLGGWGNTQHGLETPDVPLARIPGVIETGRWYDIRIELRGSTIKCYLDGRLVQEATRRATRSLYAVATRASDTGEVIVKVANTSAKAMNASLVLQGMASIAPEGTGFVLTGDGPEAENALAQPMRVAPRQFELKNVSSRFPYAFPAHSLTILRLRPGGSGKGE